MNGDTVNLIERPYLEIVDDILTAIVGGVVNEPIIYDVKIDLYPLAEPAQDVRGITGKIRANGSDQHRVFLKGIDFVFDPVENAVIWQTEGTLPTDESTFHVDYFRRDSRSPLSDINVGSVTRTIGEAIGREVATVYQQINQAYLAAFIDTARDKSLELVVSILGVKRKTKDYAIGRVTFFRDPNVTGSIAIPEGTLLATTKGEATFQTTQPRTLQQGQVRIDAPIRAGDEYKGEAGIVDPGMITEMARPIAGIDRVTNFDATFLGAEDETDEELRLRAKAILQALGKGTLAALGQVIFEERATLVESWDPNGPLGRRSDPGHVMLMVESEPERFPSLRAVVEQTRAAGVLTTLVARYIFFKPRMVVQVQPNLGGRGKAKVVQQIMEALQAYVDGLSSGDPAQGEKLLQTVVDVEGVVEKGTRIVDVIAWQSDIGEPEAGKLVDAVFDALATASASDSVAQRAAVEAVIADESPSLLPSGRRKPNRDLIQGASGQRATDQELESGEFEVVAVINDERWWVVLDIDEEDFVLVEEAA